MSTVIRLDASALMALIAHDPEFKLELQRGVVAEVLKKTFQSDFRRALEETAPSLFKELVAAINTDEGTRHMIDERLKATVQSVRSGTYGYQSSRELPTETKGLIAKAVHELIETEIAKKEGNVPKLVEQLYERLLADLQRRADIGIERAVDQQMERRIAAGVAERLNAILAGLKAEPTT